MAIQKTNAVDDGCTEVLGLEEEARRGGSENCRRSYEGRLREDDQAEEETRGRSSPEGWQEDRGFGVCRRKLKRGRSSGPQQGLQSECKRYKKKKTHRGRKETAQKETNAFEKELDRRFEADRKGYQQEKRNRKPRNHGGGEYPQTRGAEGFPGEAPTRR